MKGLDPNDSRNPTIVRPGALENGRHYRLVVSVRLLAHDRASIDVALDGNRYLPHWEGDVADLSPQEPQWKMPNPRQFGFGRTIKTASRSIPPGCG